MANDSAEILAGNRKSNVSKAMGEVTVADTTENPWYLTRPWNPDDLYQKNGDYSVYESMRQDDQISSSLQLKKDLILGSGFKISSIEEGQEDIVADIMRVLEEDLSKPFLDYCEEMLDFEDMGFSLTEKIYRTRDDGTLTIKDLRTRHPGSWLIHTDPKGNILNFEQRGAAGDIHIKPEENKLIHLMNKPKYLNPYGTSALRTAHLAWISKRETIKYYDIYLEMAASPKPVGKYPLASKDGIATKLSQILKSFQAKTSIVIPKEVEVEWLEAKTNGEAFLKAINLWNMLIGRALLIPDLMGFTGGETKGGSFSLGKEQINIHFKHIARKRKALEDAINKQILSAIILWNWGDIEKPPKFEFKPLQDELALDYARLFLEAVKGKVYKANDEEINHFRKAIHFPEGDVEFPAPPTTGFGNRFGGDDKDPSKPVDGKEKPNDKQTEKNKIDELQAKEKKFAKDDGLQEQREQDEKMRERFDFEKARSTLDASISGIVSKSSPLIDDMVQSVVDQIEKKKILEKQDLTKVNEIKFKNLKPISVLIKKQFRDLHQIGENHAREEIFVKKFADSSPLMNDAFLAVIDSETFDAIGDWKFKGMAAIRTQLQEAIKAGAPLSSVIPLIEDELDSQMRVSVERWARTKTTEVYNKGRLAFFDESGIVDGYQYSAIMDDRTTVICAGLHGKKFKKGTQPNPPQHFNCRSVLIPITKFESFEADTSVGGKVAVGGVNAEKNKTNFPKTGGSITIPNQSIESFIKENTGKGFEF